MSAAVMGIDAAPAPKEIKVERGYPLIGVAASVLRDGPRFLTRIAREHPGEIVGVRMGPVTVYLVTHPDHVQKVLHDDWRSYGKGGMWDAARALVGNGLASSEGDFWLRQRRMMQPLFNNAHIAGLADLMVDVIDRELTGLLARGSGPVDIEREMNAMTQRVLLETMFGGGIDRSETDRLGEELHIAFKGLNTRMFLYFLSKRIPLPGERRYREAIEAIDLAMLRLVRARRAEGAGGKDLLSLLVRARDEDTGEGMDDGQLRDELVTMFVAGQETTATSLTWLWYALDQNPEVERSLRFEVTSELGDRRPTFEDLPRLKYTKLCLQETMRLYPPAWMLPRFTARETIIDGHRIPAASPVLLCTFATQRDPAFWSDPEVFDPKRFTPERSAGRPRYAYYPFGGGPRQCIGASFAMMEAQLITAMMAQRLRPRLARGQRVVPTSLSTLKPRGGLKMNLDRAAATGSGTPRA